MEDHIFLMIRAQQRQIDELFRRTCRVEAVLDVISKEFGLSDVIAGLLREQSPTTPPILYSGYDSNGAATTNRSWQDSTSSDGVHSHVPGPAAAALPSALLSRVVAAAPKAAALSAAAAPKAPAAFAAAASKAAGPSANASASCGDAQDTTPYGLRSASLRQDQDLTPDQEPSVAQEFQRRAGDDQSLRALGAVATPAGGVNAAAFTPTAMGRNPDWHVRDELSVYSAASVLVSPPSTFNPTRRLPKGALLQTDGASAAPPPSTVSAAEPSFGYQSTPQALVAAPPAAAAAGPLMSGGWGSPEDDAGHGGGDGAGAAAGGGGGGGGGGGEGVVASNGSDAFPELGGEARLAEFFKAAGSETVPWIRRLARHTNAAAAKAVAGNRQAADVEADAATSAALALMLQCRADSGARVAVAASADTLRIAATMMQSQLHLDQRIAAHLFWFASRSREGTAALLETRPAPSPVATAAATAPEEEEVEEAGARPAPGLVGLLLAATGSKDAHTAKAAAMALYNVMLAERGASAVESADDRCGLVPALMALMGAADNVQREAAAQALSVAAERGLALRDEMIERGCVEALVGLLPYSNLPTQASAAAALEHLCLEPEATVRLAACGGVPRLVELLRHGDVDARVRAAGVLRNVADVAQCHSAILEAGVLPLLASIIVSVRPALDLAADANADVDNAGGSGGGFTSDVYFGGDGGVASRDGQGGDGGGGEELEGREASRASFSDGVHDDDDEDFDKENRAPAHCWNGGAGGGRGSSGEEVDGGEARAEQEGQEGAEEEGKEALETRVLSVNTLVNLALCGSSEVRRALAAPDGGGGGGSGGALLALLSVAEHREPWDAETVAWALEGVLAICADRSLRAEVVRLGGVHALQEVMLGGAPVHGELAAKAIANITGGAGDDLNKELLMLGVGETLLELLSAPPGFTTSGARHAACAAIQNMARCAACHAPLLADGAAEALTAVAADDDDPAAVTAAVRALYLFARSIDSCGEMLARGLVPGLIAALERLGTGTLALEPSPFGYSTALFVDGGAAATAAASTARFGGGNDHDEEEEEEDDNDDGKDFTTGISIGHLNPGGKVAETLAKVLKRLSLYDNDRSSVRQDVQSAFSGLSIL